MDEEVRQLRHENAAIHLSGGIVRLDLYRLFCYFYASKAFSEKTDGSDYCSFAPLRGEFEKEEVIRILVTSAIFGRRFEKRFISEGGPKELSESSDIGILQENLNSEEVITLNMREACNKIIHAEHIVIDEEEPGNPYYRWMKPEVHFYSSPTKSEGWKATIEIDKFVTVFSDLASMYE